MVQAVIIDVIRWLIVWILWDVSLLWVSGVPPEADQYRRYPPN
jgi:hypothetical protein